MAPKVKTLNQTEIAAEMEVTTRTVRNYVADGMPTRTVNGETRYVARECHRWRREREVEQALAKAKDKQPGEALDKDQEQAEKLRVERQIKELELARLRAELIPTTVYQERLEQFLGGFTAVAAGRLQRFERDIVRATDAVAARHVTQAIQRALMEGAQEYADGLEEEIRATDVDAEAA